MYDNLNAPHCTCHYQYAWRYEGPTRAMEIWGSVLSAYAEDCTIGQHSALAALLAPKPEPSGWHAEMRRRANDEREQAGLPREDETEDERLASRLEDLLNSDVVDVDVRGIARALDHLHSDDANRQKIGVNAARVILGDERP